MHDLISKRKYGYVLSAILVTVGLVFTLATLIPNGNVGLQFSIAYTGGTIWEVHFQDGVPEPDDVRAILEAQDLPGSEVAITGAGGREYVLMRTEALALIEQEDVALGTAVTESEPVASPAAVESPGASPVVDASAAPAASAAPLASVIDEGPVAGVPTLGQFGELATALQAAFGPIDEVRQQNSVGPVVSAELIQQTFLLILFAALAIMAWVTYRFRDFRMGVTAIVALVHDVIIVVGTFAVLGTLTGLQIDALFVTAMLTVIGYSVHDTIVVFDRVRENRQRFLGEPMEDIVNHSLMQTLGRSFTTSLTLVVTLVALMLFAGEAIRPFTFALTIGVIAGTYSSMFVATPLFLDWNNRAGRRKAKIEAQAEASPA